MGCCGVVLRDATRAATERLMRAWEDGPPPVHPAKPEEEGPREADRLDPLGRG